MVRAAQGTAGNRVPGGEDDGVGCQAQKRETLSPVGGRQGWRRSRILRGSKARQMPTGTYGTHPRNWSDW